MESILNSIKKLLGIQATYTQFDQDIIMHINSVFFNLMQIGVGPERGFIISDANATWASFAEDPDIISAVKTYMYFKVRLAFDPPQMTALIESMNRQIAELEWRICAEADLRETTEGEEEIQNG